MSQPPTDNPYAAPVASSRPPEPDDAPTSPGPRGIGGWLIFPMLGLFLTPLRTAETLLTSYVPLFEESGDFWVITDSESSAYEPLWGPLVVAEIIVQLGLAAAAIYALLLLRRHARGFPPLMVAIYVASVVYLFVDSLVASLFLTPESATPDFVAAFQAVLVAAIWVPYFLRSVRVKNTFVKA